MSKRTNKVHEDALNDFSTMLRKQIKEDLKFWEAQDPIHAKGREMAYRACLIELRNALAANGLCLGDVGLGGYDVPTIELDD